MGLLDDVREMRFFGFAVIIIGVIITIIGIGFDSGVQEVVQAGGRVIIFVGLLWFIIGIVSLIKALFK